MQLELKLNIAGTKDDSSTTAEVASDVRRHNTNAPVGRSALYVLSTNWGEFLQEVSINGGTMIFLYTNIFSRAKILTKQQVSFYCSIKDFFKPLKLAG